MRRVVALTALLSLAACSSSGPKESAAPAGSDASSASAAASASATPTSQARPSASVPTASRTTAGSGSTGSGPAGGGSTGATGATAGTPSVRSTPPGTYTYDSSGSQTFSGARQDVDATSTLTMSPLTNGQQSSTQHNSQGDTTQQLDVRSTGSYLASLTIDSPTLKTAFHFAPPALLLPDPARVGATWSWRATSDDGRTEVTAANRVLRTETLTIGGERVATVVLQTHLVITGQSVRYTADATNWAAPAYRLPVRTRTTGSGTYGTFAFSFDVTDVLRSVHPS